MAKDLDRLQRALEGGDFGPFAACWSPHADVVRTRHGWLIKVELAGVRAEDLAVRLEQNGVTVAGVRRDVVLEPGDCIQSMEIAYSRFQRTFALCSRRLARASVDTRFENGMLLVYVRCDAGERTAEENR